MRDAKDLLIDGQECEQLLRAAPVSASSNAKIILYQLFLQPGCKMNFTLA